MKKTSEKTNSQQKTRGLVIKKEPLEKILAGKKTWEMRSTRTKNRGLIALIESKSGLIVGTAELIGCEGPLPLKELRAQRDKHQGDDASIEDHFGYKKKHGAFAWVLKDARRLTKPIPYKHPNGAVIWVNLDYLESSINAR